jgi:hypothetical protein
LLLVIQWHGRFGGNPDVEGEVRYVGIAEAESEHDKLLADEDGTEE